MISDAWLEETYFTWLKSECFLDPHKSQMFDGVLRLLHEIPFYWTMWSDENRAGDALTFRQYEFLDTQPDLDRLDQVWLGQWATAAPSVLEVLLGIARRWSYYFQRDIQWFFHFLFHNMGFDRFPGKVLSTKSQLTLRTRVDDWMSRQFQPNGQGSPFPVSQNIDMRQIDIWGQMNAYSAEHFQ